jgi:hypothetical protein
MRDEKEDLEFTVKDDPRPTLPPGAYEAVFMRSEKKHFFGQPKLYVHFKIISSGEHEGVELYRAYNFYDPLKRESDLFKELTLLLGRRVPKGYKLSLKLFRGKVLEVLVRTVVQNRRQGRLPDHETYSVIQKIVRVVVGHQPERQV